MNKILKYVRKLRKKEQLKLLEIMTLIELNRLEKMDIKKMSGHKDLYRVRLGKFRIIFKKDFDQNHIVKVEEKNDQTYKNL